MQLEKNRVHLWRVFIADLAPTENNLATLLSEDELLRADRFRFPEDKQRFIIARATLRNILSLYLGILPENILFSYGLRGKPFLTENPSQLQFNLSHSDELVVYAFTIQNEIGIDIEKISEKYNENIAKRFFSEQEYQQWSALSKTERMISFYKIWAYKEALIKLLGEGLYVSLGDFSISLINNSQRVLLKNTEECFLEYFVAHPAYQAAFATRERVKKIEYWQWKQSGPIARPFDES